MRRWLVALGCLMAGSFATTAGAVDLNGKWRFTAGSAPATIVQVTQSLSTVSFTLQGVVFTGSVSSASGAFANYSVQAISPPFQAGIGGRVMPSGNLLDGRTVVFIPFQRLLRLEPGGDALHLRRRQHGERRRLQRGMPHRAVLGLLR